MIYFIILLSLFFFSSLNGNPIINNEIVSKIKLSGALWMPMNVDENPFEGWGKNLIKKLMGTKLKTREEKKMFTIYRGFLNNDNTNISDNFDSRTKWPNCIHPIRNQLHCGACWAFAAVEAFNDRLCIKDGGEKDSKILSPQDMISCDGMSDGCKGGYEESAWDYLEKVGVVSESCFPFVSGDETIAKCLQGSCIDFHIPYIKHKCKEGTVRHLEKIEDIKQEITINGPVEGGFLVYDDFMNYKNGLYSHVTGELLGGHSIKIVGFGKEDNVNYWICANSWGTAWGDKGFFKIKMGESDIEDNVYSCLPESSNIHYHQK